jgi:hypothetical protein
MLVIRQKIVQEVTNDKHIDTGSEFPKFAPIRPFPSAQAPPDDTCQINQYHNRL